MFIPNTLYRVHKPTNDTLQFLPPYTTVYAKKIKLLAKDYYHFSMPRPQVNLNDIYSAEHEHDILNLALVTNKNISIFLNPK